MRDRNMIIERNIDRERRRHENLERYREALKKMQNDPTEKNASLRDYYNIKTQKRAEIREVVEEVLDYRDRHNLWTSRLTSAAQSGFIFGFLGGAIVGGYNSAISGAFTWSIIRAVVEGISLNN